MTKLKKQMLSFLTAIIMIVGLVGVMPTVSAGAAGGVANKVQAAVNRYRNGGYTYNSIGQCLGLVKKVTKDVFGYEFVRTNEDHFYTVASGNGLSTYLNNAKVGDVIDWYYWLNSGGTSGHTGVVVENTGSSITWFDATSRHGITTHTVSTTSGWNSWWGNATTTIRLLRARNYDSVDGGHTCDSNNSYISKNATCTSTGTRTYTCSVCGKTTRTETISALGHSYGGWTTTKESTCTEVGSKYQSCSRCGYKNTQSISKKSHSYTTSDIKPKSTSEKGYTDHTCTMCGNNYKDNYIELKSDGYYYGEKLPSWADNSNYTVEYKCHSEKIATTSPGDGWVNSGVSRVEWQNSGPLYENYFYELPTSDSRVLSKIRYFHFCGPKAGTKVNYEMRDNYVHWDQVDGDSVSVTSQGMDGSIPYYLLNWNNGSGRVYCKSGVTCDGSNGTHGNRAYAWYRIYVYQDRTKITYYKFTKDTNWSNTKDSSASSVEMRFKQKVCTNHSYGDWTTTKPATCTTAGTKTRKCSFCGNTETQTIAATGHNYNDWTTTKPVTCTTAGTKTRKCSVCGNTETQTIAATGHKYSTEWTIDKAATCTEKGSKSHHCTVCGDKKDVTEVAATGHKYVTSVVNPTETEKGYTLHKCSICGESYKDNYVDPLKPDEPIEEPTEEPTDPPYGDFNYTILEDGTVEITGYTGNATELTIPSEIEGKSVTSIGDYAFNDCYSLERVTIPSSVEYVTEQAFDRCYSFKEINVSEDNQYYSSLDGVLYDKEKTELILCPYVKSSVSIPDSVEYIGNYAFEDCSSLISITIPDSVTSIGDSAFWSCYSLTSITMPDSVISIGEMAFSWCESLTSITIPDSVTSIGDDAFYGTPLIYNQTTDIKYVGKWAVSCDNETTTTATIKEGTVGIADYAFGGCSNLKSITIPNSVTIIGEMALGYAYDYDIYETVKIDDFKIYCYSGTAGEQYAIDNGFDYILLDGEQSLGDLSDDGKITTVDVGIINSFAKGTKEYTDEQLKLADANKDGKITTVDVGLINKIAKGV